MTALVLRGDARRLPLPDESVDLIVTSPPYFALRSYTDNGGQHYGGQIGSEPTPGEYIDNLIACTCEWTRVLKPTGSLWVNLGDKYAQNVERSRNGAGNRQTTQPGGLTTGAYLGGTVQLPSRDNGVPTKSLMGLPWRYALRCIDDLGLILRAEVIWSKVNGLPESVRDRVRRSHEQWFHMVRQPRYFAAVDKIRTPHSAPTAGRNPHGARGGHYRVGADGLMTNGLGSHPTGVDGHLGFNPLGALPGSVWTVATQPLKVPAELGIDHFAAFPMELPRRIILGWSPSGICTACGEGRRPVVAKRADSPPSSAERVAANGHSGYAGWSDGKQWIHARGAHPREGSSYDLTGEACACPDTTAPTRPAVVLDPFGGTGTTALVAKALGRVGITVDRSADYCSLAGWRTNDPGQLAAALEVEKPPKQVDDQLDLFAEVVP